MTRSERAWQAFQAQVTELGGIVIEPTWLGSGVPHRVRCPAGHDCTPRPTNVKQGQGLCRACVGHDSTSAEAAFRFRIAELGGVVVEPGWLGKDTPHRVRCSEGHDCAPTPGNVRRGQGICRACVGHDPASAEATFRSRVAELGGVVVEPVWLGCDVPHRVRCVEGHSCTPIPTCVRQGQGLCRVCAGHDPASAETAFQARVAELGGVVIEPGWLGSGVPHRVQCAKDHVSAPHPSSVQQGQGICRMCAGRVWDAFYVVSNDACGRLKVGITSGSPRYRVSRHRLAGYRTVIRLLTDLPGDAAPTLERRVLSALKLAGERPIRGREYFESHVLATVLDIVDHYPIRQG